MLTAFQSSENTLWHFWQLLTLLTISCGLHTCLSHKLFFMFAQDAYNADLNEPSSNEDEEVEVDNEDIFHGASNQQFKWHRSLCPFPHSVVHPPTSLITHSPSSLNGPPTSPIWHTNPLHPGKSLVILSVLPHSIWTWGITLTPRHYDGLFIGQQVILDKVYKLASRGSWYFMLDVWGTSVDAMAEHLQALL